MANAEGDDIVVVIKKRNHQITKITYKSPYPAITSQYLSYK
jgi:hypothetical protein